MPFEFFFPKTFYYRDELISEADNRALVDEAYALKREFPESTRSHIYTTYGNLQNVLSREEFTALQQAVVDEVLIYLRQVETPEDRRFAIPDSWVSISSPGNYERMHIHGGAYVSGVYYIQTAPKSGRIFFENMDDNLWASKRTQRENYSAVSYEPTERRLILFNSYVPHHVEQNRSSTDRIIVSFNVVLV